MRLGAKSYVCSQTARQQINKEIYDRHTILNDFLQNVLGVPADVAESDACKMEHIISDESISAIEKFTNK